MPAAAATRGAAASKRGRGRARGRGRGRPIREETPPSEPEISGDSDMEDVDGKLLLL